MARLPDPAVRQRWSELISLYERSELTVVDFCDLHDVSTASFYQWRNRLRQRKSPARGEFLPVEISHSIKTIGTTVRFPCGTVIELDSGVNHKGDGGRFCIVCPYLATVCKRKPLNR